MKKKYCTFLYLLFVSLFFSACGLENESSLKIPEPIICPKPELQHSLLQEKDLSINIDKIVMIMPEEAKKQKIVQAPKKKKIRKKPQKIKKKKIPKKKISKKKKTVIVIPKKLVKKKKDIGDTICRNGGGLLSFMPIELIGKVQQKKGDTIKVKITDSYSDDQPMYNGIGLYKNTVLWDKHYNWKLCK